VFFLLEEGRREPFCVLLAVVLMLFDAYLTWCEEGFIMSIDPNLLVLRFELT
jgi:hypothetical protein